MGAGGDAWLPTHHDIALTEDPVDDESGEHCADDGRVEHHEEMTDARRPVRVLCRHSAHTDPDGDAWNHGGPPAFIDN